MLELPSVEQLTTVGVVGPSRVTTELRDARAATDTEVAVKQLTSIETGIQRECDSIVVATSAADDERVDGTTTVPEIQKAASQPESIPVVLIAPVEASIAETLRAGITEYLPWSVFNQAPGTVLQRVVRAAIEAGTSDYRTIYDNVSEPLTLHDPETGELVHANQQLSELLGYERSELISMQVAEYTADIDGYDQASAMELITSATEAGVAGPVRWPLESKNGTQVWVEATLTPVKISGQKLILSTATDVTDQVHREQEYKQIFNGVNDAIAVHNPQSGRIVDVNDSYLELTGYDREWIRNEGIEGLSVTEEGYTGERATELITEVAESETEQTVEWRIETASGQRRTVEANLTVATVGGQRRVLSITRDVTEQRRRRREFEQIFNAVDDPITIHDPETAEHIRINDGFCDLLGYTRDEIMEMGIDGYSVTEEGYTAEYAREFVRSVINANSPQETEWLVETSDGERRWLRVKGTTAEIDGEQRFVSVDRDITERRRREQEYEQIFNGVNDVITIHDPDTGEYVHVNETLCELTGYTRAEILEMGINGVSATEDGYTAERAKTFIERVVETGEPDTVEWKIETADGDYRWLEVNGSVATIGGEQRFVTMDRDITEAKRRQREYEQIFNGVNDAIAVFDPDTAEIVEVNDRYHELLGYDNLGRIQELGIEGLSVTEEGYTGERGQTLIAEVAETGEPQTVQWQAQRRDGERVWLEVTLAPATIVGQQRVLSIQRDITERKRREQEYEQIFHGVPGPITINDPDTGELLDVNDALCDMLGYSREEILELGNDGLAADEPGYDGETASKIVQRVMESGEPETFDWKLKTATGQTRILEVTGKPAQIGGEQRYVSLTRDVTEQRRRQREFEQIFHSVTDIINVYDPDTGELLDVNQTMCDLLGYDRDRILELGPDGVSASELGYDGETVEAVVTEVANTDEPRRGIEWALRTASGEILWLEVNATPAEINGRQRVLAIARDVTKRRDREERVQVLNRVLRHNLRNDMDAVQAYATAIDSTAENDRLSEYAQRINETATGLLRLSAKARSTEEILRERGRGQVGPVEDIVNTVIAEARDRFEECTFSVGTTVRDERLEECVFRLVLSELVENAAEHGSEPVVVRTTSASERDELVVEVSDNGPGIPDRVLTPFRTGGETQFEHNQGLGLWLVNWGVRRLGGSIEFDRPADGGTIATLRLPVID